MLELDQQKNCTTVTFTDIMATQRRHKRREFEGDGVCDHVSNYQGATYAELRDFGGALKHS